MRVEPRGFEPLTSAVQRRLDTLLERSVTCRIPANCRISALALFPAFQEIHSGCCTVAALGSPSRDTHQICTRLHIHAVPLHVMRKGTEQMDSSIDNEP
jgi:hypothetical protein